MPKTQPHPANLTTRKMALPAKGGPSTLNAEARTLDAVMATETPSRVVDWERFEVVDEVLLMEGATYPGQVPLLNAHSRYSVEDVLGSVSNIRVDGSTLVGTVEFSTVPEAENALTKVREGHLTDFSIGYTVQESVWIPEGQKQIVSGREFSGPVKVSTHFSISELSICPIGADKLAKARAAANLNHQEEVMPEKEKGRSPATEPTPETPEINLDELRSSLSAEAEAKIAANNQRSAELLAMGRRFDCLELAEKAIADGTSVLEFNAVVLEHVAAKRKLPEQQVGFQAEMGISDKDKFRSAATDAVLVRAGRAEEGNDLAGLTLRELARECLVRAGQRPPMHAMDMLGRALTTSDFPHILSNVANKSLLEGFETASETWSQWCATGQVSDFKINTKVRAGETDDLDEIPEHAEYKYGQRSEEREQYAIATYGKLFALSRQAIINDDLGVLTDIPASHGEAAARKIGDVAYAVLTSNATMGDGVALFHADHNNLTSSGAVVDVPSLGAGFTLMRRQKDIGGKRRLNIVPQYFIAPVSLEVHCETFFASSLIGTRQQPNIPNIYSGSKLIRVYEPRLDDDSVTAWYLAGPKGKTVTLFFLDGIQTPYMEVAQGWHIDGAEWKVRIDCGAKAMSWKGLYKNVGA